MAWRQIRALVQGILFVGMVAAAQDNPFETAAKIAYSGVYEGKDADGATYLLVLCERGAAFDGTVSRGGNVMQVTATFDGTALSGEMRDANGASPIKVVVSDNTATFIAGTLKVELKRRDGPSFSETFSGEAVKIALAAGQDRSLAGSLKFRGQVYEVKAQANGALCWGTFGAGERSWPFTLQRESPTEVLFRTGTFAQALRDDGELARREQEAARRRWVEEERMAVQRRRQEQERLAAQRKIDEDKQQAAAREVAKIRAQAEGGNAWAQNNLGCRYEAGEGVRKDLAESFRWFLRAAQQGYAMAQHNVGLQYHYGRGVEVNDEEAVGWFRKAAEQRHPVAQLYLGHAYRDGWGVDQDYAMAMRLYLQAANRKQASAAFAVGDMYERGLGVPQSYDQALVWYRSAAAAGDSDARSKMQEHDRFVDAQERAEAGDPTGQSDVAEAYTRGKGVLQDYTKALEWYLKAADLRSATAECGLGDAYYNGRGVARDRTEAARWYRKSAEQGNPRAQVSLGHAYRRGAGVERDYTQAIEWYLRAAEQQDARAQYSLGRMYEQGLGVPTDYEQALSWFRKAAAADYSSARRKVRERDQFLVAKAKAMGGDAAAQRELAEAYAAGTGVAEDDLEATVWFRKAAEKDDATAQYRLAVCYCRGDGVRRNDQEAATWCRRAAEKGERQAQHLLGVLLHSGRCAKQDNEQAVNWLRKAAEQGNCQAMYDLGFCYEQGSGVAQDLVQAAAWYAKAIENLEPEINTLVWAARARALEEQGELKQLDETLDALVKRVPDSPIPYRLRGLGHERQGRTAEAIRDYRKAVELLPESDEANARLAAIWQAAGAHAKAVDAYTMALRRNPGWASGYARRALAWARAGDMDKAQADCARALDLDPEDPRTLNRLAWTYLTQPSLRNPADALALAKRALPLADDDSRASVLDTLACAQAANGQFDDAVRLQKEAIALVTSDLAELAELQEHLQAFEQKREPTYRPVAESLKTPTW